MDSSGVIHISTFSSGILAARKTGNDDFWNVEQQKVEGVEASKHFFSIYFVDSENGFAVGEKGIIIKTTNGGALWTAQQSGTTSSLYDVYFINKDTGYACGTGGVILKTVNGGDNWTLFQTTSENTLRTIQFVGSQIGFVMGDYCTTGRTMDGGNSWTMTTQSSSRLYGAMHFADSQYGWICADYNTILKTTNGGESWRIITGGEGAPERIWKSVYFFNRNHGVVVGENSLISRTTNGGINWIDIPNIYSTTTLYSVFMTDTNLIYMAGSNGLILLYDTNTDEFKQVSCGNARTLHTIVEVDDSTMLVGGENEMIMRSKQIGAFEYKWEVQKTRKSNYNVKSIVFPQDTIGIAVTDGGIVLRTTNKGRTWDSVYTSPNSKGLTCAFTTDKYNIYIVGFGGVILKSTNSGENWRVQTCPVTSNLRSVTFKNLLYGMAISDDGTVIVTTNGGTNWTQPTATISKGMNSIAYCKAEDAFWVVGASGAMQKTTNFGGLWSSFTPKTDNDLNSISISPDGKSAIAVGNFGTVLLGSLSGTMQWELCPDFVENDVNLYGCSAANNNIFRVVGEEGTIYTTSTGGISGIDESFEFKEDFSIYPSPCSQYLTIDKISIVPKEIEIFNLSGELILKNVPEFLSDGKYFIDVDDLPSGVYILRVCPNMVDKIIVKE
jgi:photosystem II stability/assembly factor-like uncharacterized protein